MAAERVVYATGDESKPWTAPKDVAMYNPI